MLHGTKEKITPYMFRCLLHHLQADMQKVKGDKYMYLIYYVHLVGIKEVVFQNIQSGELQIVCLV